MRKGIRFLLDAGTVPMLLAAVILAAGCAGDRRMTRSDTDMARAKIALLDITSLGKAQRGPLASAMEACEPGVTLTWHPWRRGLASDAAGRWTCLISPPEKHRVFGSEGGPGDTSQEGQVIYYEYGPLHATILVGHDPVEPNTALYERLLKGLSFSEKPWKIVLMREAIFLPGVKRSWLPLARFLEKAGVDLVIAPGRGYQRTLPIGPSAESVVRYVVLGTRAGRDHPSPGWVAHAVSESHFCIVHVTEDRLEWSVYNASGHLVDVLSLDKGTAGCRFVSVSQMLAEEKARERRKRSAKVKEKATTESQE